MTRASKILPPSIPRWSIARPALEELLDESLSRRLTTVVAGAGFGKSTLLARWGAGVRCAWYTIDAADASLATITPGLIEALRAQVPDLPADLTGQTGGAAAAPGQARSWAESFASHLSESLQERLTADLVLVVDDLQELHPDSPAARLIEGLCRHAPELFHLILSSRSEPPFPIERLRGRGQVLSVEPAMLAFSIEEVEELLDASVGDGSAALAGPLHEMTGGWPAALRLAVEALRSAAPDRRELVLEDLRRPGGALFDYLAEEVLAREPGPVRDLLRRMAPFGRFTIELCEALGLRGADKTLAELVRRGLFVQTQGGQGPWFTLHALVREFVLGSWPFSERELRTLRRRAATWFESRGHLEEALQSLGAASAPRAIAGLLAKRGTEMVASGAVESIIRLAEGLPPRLRDQRIEELLGEAYAVRGDAARALECFHRAAGDSEQLPPGLAWRMGLMHHERGEHEEAMNVFERGRVDGSLPAEEALLLAANASTHLLTGDVESSQKLTARALASAEASADPRALAATHAALMLQASGRSPQAADIHYRSALQWAERAHDVLLCVRIRTNHASHLDDEGAYEEALEELEVAIRQAELAGYTERLALALNNRATSRFHLGHLEEAIADFKTSKALYERAGSIRACWPIMNMGVVFRERGDLALARSALEEALSLARKSEDAQGLIGVQADLARIVVAEDPDEAGRLASSAVAISRSWGGLVAALVAAGWVALARGEREIAERYADEATREARARRNRPGLAEALELEVLASPEPARQTRGLEEAIAIWREIKNPLAEARAELALARLSPGSASRTLEERALRRLQVLGVRPEAAAAAAGLLACVPHEESPPIAIWTLGGFRVLRSGQPVPASDWQSKKARDLVKILLARRGRPTPRDVLMDALWPEEDARRLANRLSVALATARAVLDPDRRFPSEHFIGGDDSALWLDLTHLPVDVERFLAETSAGFALQRGGQTADAREVLAAAEAKYTGDFLEEDLYEDWAAPLREEARATYTAVAHALAQAASQAGDRDAAIRYRLRILQRDPYDEEAHLGLVSMLAAAGRHGEARRSYRTYVSQMEDLGVEPAPFPHAA